MNKMKTGQNDNISDKTKFSRRQIMFAAGAAVSGPKFLSAQDGGLTARLVVERIQKNVGIPWRLHPASR